MQSDSRPNRKERIGIVISDKMDKTITVQVERVSHHSVYDRSVKKSAKFKAHDEKNAAKVGDLVRIEETRPLSKTKRWRLVEVMKRSAGTANEAADSITEDKAKK